MQEYKRKKTQTDLEIAKDNAFTKKLQALSNEVINTTTHSLTSFVIEKLEKIGKYEVALNLIRNRYASYAPRLEFSGNWDMQLDLWIVKQFRDSFRIPLGVFNQLSHLAQLRIENAHQFWVAISLANNATEAAANFFAFTQDVTKLTKIVVIQEDLRNLSESLGNIEIFKLTGELANKAFHF
jgi:hypothetical protein